jgi:glutamine synthetase
MGADLVRCFLAIRRDEVRRWEATGNDWSVEHITDWEYQQYLPFY